MRTSRHRSSSIKAWTNGLAFSADSSLLVSSGWDGSVALFDGKTAALLGSITTPNQQLVTADFLADGQTVMIAAYDDGIYQWDTAAGACDRDCVPDGWAGSDCGGVAGELWGSAVPEDLLEGAE